MVKDMKDDLNKLIELLKAAAKCGEEVNMSTEFEFENGFSIRMVEPKDIKFKEITDKEIAEMFNMLLEEFKKEVKDGKIKSWA